MRKLARAIAVILCFLALAPLVLVAGILIALMTLILSPLIICQTLREMREEARTSGWEDENS